MYQSDAEVLFPIRVVPELRKLRGKVWQDLVECIEERGTGSLEEQAFTLMMIRIDGCLACHAHSFRAIRGCTMCATNAIVRFKGSDTDLQKSFEAAMQDIINWHETGEVPHSEQLSPEIQ